MNLPISAESLLRQMPGIFGIKQVTDKSRFYFVDDMSAKIMGFSNADDLIGLAEEDVKCDAIVNNAEIFYKHDQLVMTNKTLRTLDIYPHEIENIFGVLAIKKPLLDGDGNVCAVMVQGVPLAKADIDNILHYIPYFSYSFKKNSKVMGQTYQINDSDAFFNLTKKELECFFYMLRGKSAGEIAQITCRSLKTIETHMQHIKYKCNVNKKSELFDLAYSHGLLQTIPHSLLSKVPKFTQILSQ